MRMRIILATGPARLALATTLATTLACATDPPPCDSDVTLEEVSVAVNTAADRLTRRGMRFDATLWGDAKRWNPLNKAIDRELGCTSENAYISEAYGGVSEHPLKLKCERADGDDLITYNPNVAYCGFRAYKSNGLACGLRKMVSNCMNAVCWMHDACVDRLDTSLLCYWTRTTDVCDDNFFEDAGTCSDLTLGDMKVIAIARRIRLARELSLVCPPGENPWTEPPAGCECEAGYQCDDNGDCCGPFADYAVVDGVCLPSCGRGLRDAGLSDSGYGCCTETGCAIPRRSVESWDCGEHCCVNTDDTSCNP